MLSKINKLSGRSFGLLALGIFCSSRIATWLFPFDSDHWIFYYIGKHWIRGATLYVDVWDHKSPLIYAYNGLISLLFGDNIVLHRAIFTLVALVGLWLFYKTARLLYEQLKLNNSLMLARLSTLIYCFLANLAVFTNSGNNNENLGLLFLLATLYFYLNWRQNSTTSRQYLFFSGSAAGFVLMLKINFFVLLLPILIDMIIISRKNIYRLIGNLCFSFAGVLLQLLFWIIYFTKVGTLKQFYIAAIQFNGKYMGALGWDLGAPDIVVFISIMGLLVLFFAPFIIASIRSFYKNRAHNNLLVLLLSTSALLFMVLAGTFYSHYFLITLPILCLMAGAKFNDIIKFKPKLLLGGLLIIAALLFLASFKQLFNSYFGSVKDEATKQVAVANYINQHTTTNDRIFAYTYGATLYQLADRDSGSRFISASHPLIDYKFAFGYDFNRQFIYDMVDSEAKYVVMSSDPNDIYRQQNPVLMTFINHNYHLESSLSGYDILVRNSL